MGFIETPYRKVKGGKVDLKNQHYLSAEEEDEAKIAQANCAYGLSKGKLHRRYCYRSRQTGGLPTAAT
jgi:DNA-directed RNA polymerase subunit beta